MLTALHPAQRFLHRCRAPLGSPRSVVPAIPRQIGAGVGQEDWPVGLGVDQAFLGQPGQDPVYGRVADPHARGDVATRASPVALIRSSISST